MKKWVTYILFFSVLISYAQEKKNLLKMNARAQEDKILLRWAIASPIEWQKAHQKGFYLSRYTIKRDGVVLTAPEKKTLTLAPLKPEPLEQWMELIQKDNYAAIVAQAIYGDSFEMDKSNQGAVSRIVSVAEELQQRYTFALYSADMSFTAAVKAGWGFVDTNVKKNEEYAYQLTVANTDYVSPVSYAISLKEHYALPAPTDFMAIPDDRKIVLSWDYETFKTMYTSFMVEKSDDGVHFAPIANTPLVNLNDKPNAPAKRMYYVDTLSANNQKRYYRLYGVSSFGEKGELTKTISTQGIKSIIKPPRFINYNIINENSCELEWEYPKVAEGDTQHFELSLAEKDAGPYKVVATAVTTNTRRYKYDDLGASNYFKITAVGKNKQRLTSQSMLVQPIDSIPPAMPEGLEGKIDTLGVVTLKWKANTEKDLLGYRILRANNKNEEFIDIYHKAYRTNEYVDSVSLKMLNKKVYYRIMAEDRRYNLSEASAILVLEKPDVIPPAAPIFKNYTSKGGKVVLNWIRSYSDDVALHSLQRRAQGTKEWKEIKRFANLDIETYTDTGLERNKNFEYAILAQDTNGLWSSIAHSTVTVKVQDFRPVEVLKNVTGVANREERVIVLSWGYASKTKDIVSVSIYKTVKGGEPTLWKELPATFTKIIDRNLKMNSEYEYFMTPNLKSFTPAKTIRLNVKY